MQALSLELLTVAVPTRRTIVANIRRAGTQAFPSIQLALDDLTRLLGDRALDADLPDARAAEVYLALACATGDARAIALIQERFLIIAARALERGRNRELVAEAVQQLEATVFLPRPGRLPEIADFTGSGPLVGWLRIVALRILVRLERKDRRALPVDPALSPMPLPDDPEVSYLRRRYSAALQQALTDAWAAMATDTRVLLRLRYSDNLGIDEIAAMEQVHRATAARRLCRAEELLIQKTRALLRERLGASDQEIHSALRAVRSGLHLSLSAIVGA